MKKTLIILVLLFGFSINGYAEHQTRGSCHLLSIKECGHSYPKASLFCRDAEDKDSCIEKQKIIFEKEIEVCRNNFTSTQTYKNCLSHIPSPTDKFLLPIKTFFSTPPGIILVIFFIFVLLKGIKEFLNYIDPKSRKKRKEEAIWNNWKKETEKYTQEKSKENKLVFFFDDIQWIDESSLDLLKKLISYFKQNSDMLTNPLVIVLSSRTSENLQDISTDDYLNKIIELEQFSEHKIGEFLNCAGLSVFPKSFAKEVYDYLGTGNPQHILEFMRGIISAGQAEEDSDGSVTLIPGFNQNDWKSAVPKELNNQINNCDITFIMPHQLNLIKNKNFDLTIAVNCIHEMDKNTIQNYFTNINNISKLFYFSVWKKTKVPFSGILRKNWNNLDYFNNDYNIPENWLKKFEKDLVFPSNFICSGYEIK